MTPSKKLLKDFAAVTLPGYEQNPHVGFEHELSLLVGDMRWKYANLQSWEQVIELAQKKHDSLKLHYEMGDKYGTWVVEIKGVTYWDSEHKSLPVAIMRAIVAASKTRGG